MTPRYFCAVPARGGSERLPRKNVLPLGGRPLIAHTIETALAARRFDAVYVCTDDPEIAEAAKQAGALVPALIPAELAGPLVASHVPCQWMRERVAPDSDVLVCLQPTSPLRSAGDINAGLARFEAGGVDYVVSVSPIDPHYFHWACVPDGGDPAGTWRMFFGNTYMRERSLLPPVHRPTGSIKIARVETLARTGNFFGAGLGVIDVPEDRSIHVATRLDLELCETLLRRAGTP
jgi:CMP-N,N'-diacetyllegionaminic acid synthase